MNKKIILASHGKLSAGMIHSIQMIVGKREDLSCYGMMPGEHYQPIADQIEQEIISRPDVQYIVITDLLGGSVCNGIMTLRHYSNLKLVAGMNMGLVINLLLEPAAMTDEQIDEKIREAKESVIRIGPENVEKADNLENFFQ